MLASHVNLSGNAQEQKWPIGPESTVMETSCTKECIVGFLCSVHGFYNLLKD